MPTKCIINTTTEVTVEPPKKYYVKIYDRFNEPNYAVLTEEQFRMLNWLDDLTHDMDWEEITPNDIFVEI